MSLPLENTTILAHGKFLLLCSREGWEFVHRPNVTGIVAILAVTEQNEILLVEQHRKPVAARVIEIPAGLAGDIEDQTDEPLSTAAQRELLEETGYRAAAMELLTQGPPSAGASTEQITLFRARGLTRETQGGGDGTEDIVVHRAPLATIDAWLREREMHGCQIDPKVYTALYFAAKP
ncbi:MAG: NUDIX hydrolase [Planctomycetota bacterium]